MAKGDIPRIVWGDSWQHTLDVGYPIFNAVSYSEPREGSEFVAAPSGERDAWVTGTDQFLEGEIRYVPPSDATNPTASGWDAADGWRAFFEWARAANAFRWYDDKDAGFRLAYLIEPMRGAPSPADDGTRAFFLRICSQAGTSFDGY